MKVESLLQALARLYAEAQQALYHRQLELIGELLELDEMEILLNDNSTIQISGNTSDSANSKIFPMLSLVPCRSYRISELVIEFMVIEEDHQSGVAPEQVRLYLHSLGSQAGHGRPATIKIVEKDCDIFAEFQINGEIREAIVLRRNLGELMRPS